MKKGEIYEGVIEKVDFPNKGYVFVEDQKVLIKNGIPGQKVRFMIQKKRSGRAQGRILEVIEKSPLETREPVCSNFPACGGCMYQTMSYEDQLHMKETQIRELLEEALIQGGQIDENGNAAFEWEGIHGSPIEFGYRNKMEFSFGDEVKDGPLSLGLHKKGSTYDILNTDDCKLVHKDMTDILTCVREFFREKGASYYRKLQHTGYLRHLMLRRGVTSGEILVHLVTTTQEEYDLEPLKDQLLALPLEGRIVGIMHILNDSLSDVVQSDETRILYGQDYFYETLLGLKFRISTFSFFQPNSLAAEVLYNIVRDYIQNTSGMEVFDLYSGTGTIAQLLAPVAKEVIGVELNGEAVRDAKVNAHLNNMNNIRFVEGDAGVFLEGMADREETVDVVFMDPPRSGSSEAFLQSLLVIRPKKIVYISCEPQTQVRDLQALKKDYKIEAIQPVDMFPMTEKIETVVLLTRKE